MVSVEWTYIVDEDQPVILSVDDAKDHLNITHDFQDELIKSYIDAAISEAELYTSRSLLYRDVTIKTNVLSNEFMLPISPYLKDLTIKYYDEDNNLQTLSVDSYTVVNGCGEQTIIMNPGVSIPSIYNRNDAVIISYVAGFEKTPYSFTQFCKLVVGTFYEQRTDSVDNLPRFAYSLIRNYKNQWQ